MENRISVSLTAKDWKKNNKKKKHGKRERKCFPKSSQELNEGFTAMCLDEVSLSYQDLKVLIVEFV